MKKLEFVIVIVEAVEEIAPPFKVPRTELLLKAQFTAFNVEEVDTATAAPFVTELQPLITTDVRVRVLLDVTAMQPVVPVADPVRTRSLISTTEVEAILKIVVVESGA